MLSIDRRLGEELATGCFAAEGRNIVLLGPPGVGKTHLAIALGVCIAELGQRAYFTTAIELARRLTRATGENRLHRELKNLVRPSLLIIDEVGYLTLDGTQASLLFQVICQRYEKQQAIVLTSNKAFADWAQVFAGDAVMASAALDRLLHRGEILKLTGRRKALVRTSSTPGRTQLLNFFNINGTFFLVDLPGYGFAQVPLAVKK